MPFSSRTRNSAIEVVRIAGCVFSVSLQFFFGSFETQSRNRKIQSVDPLPRKPRARRDISRAISGPFRRIAIPDPEKQMPFSYRMTSVKSTPAVFRQIPSFLNSVSMASFTLCLQNSLATRIAFLMALALERP